jgi:hypothetical protein
MNISMYVVRTIKPSNHPTGSQKDPGQLNPKPKTQNPQTHNRAPSPWIGPSHLSILASQAIFGILLWTTTSHQDHPSIHPCRSCDGGLIRPIHLIHLILLHHYVV